MGKIALPQAQTSAPKPEVKPVDEPKTFVDSAVLKVREDVLQETQDEGKELTDKALEFLKLKQELGVDAANPDYDDQIKFIMHYIKDIGIKDSKEARVFIRKIKTKLGIPFLDGGSIQKIYNWLKLESAIQSLIKKQDGIK